MYYNISITKTEKGLLKVLDVDQEVAFINGLGFIDSTYALCLASKQKLPEKITEYASGKYMKSCSRIEETCICGTWCYLCYSKKGKKKNGK